jgi:hypothetical protein
LITDRTGGKVNNLLKSFRNWFQLQYVPCSKCMHALPHDVTDWCMKFLHGLCCFDFISYIPLLQLLCSSRLYYSFCWVSLCWVSFCWVSLYWVSLCWVSLYWVSWHDSFKPNDSHINGLNCDTRHNDSRHNDTQRLSWLLGGFESFCCFTTSFPG